MSTVRSALSLPNSPRKQPAVKVVNKMQVENKVQTVHCPTCGSFAKRRVVSNQRTPQGEHLIQTACPACDYFIVMGALTGRVLEAYAPAQISA